VTFCILLNLEEGRRSIILQFEENVYLTLALSCLRLPVSLVFLLLAASLSAQVQSAQSKTPADSIAPPEAKYAAGYINPAPRPLGFKSALLWGIAIADTRVSSYEAAVVEIASTQLSCRVDGKNAILNDDGGNVRGGLYQRHPWFATDGHDPIPLDYSETGHAVLLRVGQRADRVWHFWSPSPRATLPEGKLEGCTVKARVRISRGALLQMGMDYWRSSTVPYGAGGNNHEAGASNWYFPSDHWQEATFTDIPKPQF
jgi:hypothetical protein